MGPDMFGGKFYEAVMQMSPGDMAKAGLWFGSLILWWKKRSQSELTDRDELEMKERIDKFQGLCDKYGIEVNLLAAATELYDWLELIEPYVCKEHPKNLVDDAPRHIPMTCKAILGDPQGVWTMIVKVMPAKVKQDDQFAWYKALFEALVKHVRKLARDGQMTDLSGNVPLRLVRPA